MNKLIVFTALVGLGLCHQAWALATDRSQPIEITADKFSGDEVKQIATYSGNVLVKQGSIEFKGQSLSLSITPKGYRHIELVGAPASFKQKRDSKSPNTSEWMKASANRLVYDEESDQLMLKGNAKLSRSENGVEKDSTSGENITYDLRKARSVVTGAVINGQQQRVTTIIAPRGKDNSNTKPLITPQLTPTETPSTP